MSVKAWWFARERKLPNGDGRRIQRGRTHVHRGDLVLCMSGLHASRRILDALRYAPGHILCRVECGGEIIEDYDKLACTRRTYVAVVNATAMLRKFARLCALDVINMWEAPEIVRRYLRTGQEDIRTTVWAARDARDARDPACGAGAAAAAAWAAARGARDPAWGAAAAATAAGAAGAAGDRQQKRLHQMAMRIIRQQS